MLEGLIETGLFFFAFPYYIRHYITGLTLHNKPRAKIRQWYNRPSCAELSILLDKSSRIFRYLLL